MMKRSNQIVTTVFLGFLVLPGALFGNKVEEPNPAPQPPANPQMFFNEAFENNVMQRVFGEMMDNPRIHQTMMPMISKNLPEAAEYLEYLKENDPRKAREFTQELMKFSRNYTNMMRQNRELAQLHLEVERMELSVLLKGLEIKNLEVEAPESKSGLIEELASQLETLFDKKMELREYEIASMKEELADLQTLLENRKQKRGMIISRYLQEITGNSETLEW